MKAAAKIMRKAATERKSMRASLEVMRVLVKAQTTASARTAATPIG